MSVSIKPVVLLILDGWGYREEDGFNAINSANKPNWDRLLREQPHTLINTSGQSVGLPDGQMGNSEVGHLNLGAGRVVYQELTRISRSIESGEFNANPALVEAIAEAVANNKAVHLFGLLSPGGVHSHETHIHAMARMAAAQGAQKIYLHAFLDGRDTPPKSAKISLQLMQQVFSETGRGRIASVTGRFYVMDRDNRWERVEQAYNMLTTGVAEYRADDAEMALESAYQRGETDEFVKPTLVGEAVKIEAGDAVIFMNYRSDRAREITRCFIEADFDGFERQVWPAVSRFVSLTQYHKDFDIPVVFPALGLPQVLGEVLADQGIKQLRLAETEKYAHVTFFFNGGREEPFEGEERILVPSPKVATYDLQPEMSAPAVTDHLVRAIESGRFGAIICNYANSDMVGHTGDFDAAVRAIEALDRCLGDIIEAVRRCEVDLLITADHGNAEQMRDEATQQPHTAHTQNPVPLVYVGRPASLAEGGALCDVAPSMLSLMGLAIPTEMQGQPLVTLNDGAQTT